MAVPYEKAKRIALELCPEADSVQEYVDAWFFYEKAAEFSVGGLGSVIIMKEDGSSPPLVEYMRSTPFESDPVEIEF